MLRARDLVTLVAMSWGVVAHAPAEAEWQRYIDIGDERLSRRDCTVKGEVRNLTSAPLHARVSWRAYDSADIAIGTASVSVYFVPAGGRQVFESAPFDARGTVPCHRVVRTERFSVEVYDE
jgi:hypothetical protein